jgi:hypothetical protein
LRGVPVFPPHLSPEFNYDRDLIPHIPKKEEEEAEEEDEEDGRSDAVQQDISLEDMLDIINSRVQNSYASDSFEPSYQSTPRAAPLNLLKRDSPEQLVTRELRGRSVQWAPSQLLSKRFRWN